MVLKISKLKNISENKCRSGERAKQNQKQQDAVQIGHTQLFTFPKNKKTSLATAFGQS